MCIDDILKQYDREWLLIEVQKWDEEWHPVEGKVIFHSPMSDDVLKEMLKLKGKGIDIAMRYAGEFPEDIAILV
ncbi:MAG: hypothetical protein ACE5I1_00650 [bacterium]